MITITEPFNQKKLVNIVETFQTIAMKINRITVYLTKLTLLISFLVSSSFLYAQDDVKKWRFGLELAGGLSWLKPNNPQQQQDGVGFSYKYGMQFEYKMGDNFGFRSGFNVSSYRAGLKNTLDTLTLDAVMYSSPSSRNFAIDYVNIPIILKMNTNEIGYLTYFGFFGLNLGVKYDAIANISYEKDGVNKEDIPVADHFFLLNSSLVVGAGVEYNLSGHTYLVFSLTYNNGFINVFSGKVDDKENRTVSAVDATTSEVTYGKSRDATLKNVSLNVGIFF